MVGLSLAETEIEYIHDYGDFGLTTLLVRNGLLNSPLIGINSHTNGTKPNQLETNLTVVRDNKVFESSDFVLFITSPLFSFFLLITADFLYLISFLAVLIYFVRICEKAEQLRKQLHHAEMVYEP